MASENIIKFLKERDLWIDNIDDVRAAICYDYAEAMEEYAEKCLQDFMDGFDYAREVCD